jgi:hypothetical protein
MKNFLSIAIIFLCLCVTVSSQAQSYLNRNSDEHTAHTLVTTDSAYHYIDSLVMGSSEAGVFEVTVIGYATDTLYAVRGTLKFDYINRNGTLTLGSVVNDIPITTDAPLGTATFDVTAVDNKAYIRVKGHFGNSILWYCIVKRKSITKT